MKAHPCRHRKVSDLLGVSCQILVFIILTLSLGSCCRPVKTYTQSYILGFKFFSRKVVRQVPRPVALVHPPVKIRQDNISEVIIDIEIAAKPPLPVHVDPDMIANPVQLDPIDVDMDINNEPIDVDLEVAAVMETTR